MKGKPGGFPAVQGKRSAAVVVTDAVQGGGTRPGRATKSPVNTCPHCHSLFRCPDCERNQAEVGLIACELGFWKHQAVWHRAWIIAGFKEPDAVDRKQAEAELERARQDENRGRHTHAEPPREIGS